MEFQASENLVPWGLGVFGRAAVEGPTGGEFFAIGKLEFRVVGVVFDSTDADAAERGDLRMGGEFFLGDLVEVVGGDADVRGLGGMGGGGLVVMANGPMIPAVGDGQAEGIVVKLPVTPGAVAERFRARVDEQNAGGIRECCEADGETHGGESGSGEGDVVVTAHVCVPTRWKRWRWSWASCGGTGVAQGGR